MSDSRTEGTDPSTVTPETGRARRPRVWVLALIGVVLLIVISVVAWAAVSASSGEGSGATTAPATASDAASSAPSPTGSADTPSTGAGSPAAPSADADGERAMSEPNAFDAPVDIAPGVSASISSITSVDGVAAGIGESGGPAIRFEVTITNSTGEPVDLQNTRVTVDSGADRVPAGELSGGPDIVAFPASLGAGSSATAAYVFSVPVEARSDVRIIVDYLASVPLAVFAGAAPTA
ncbi:hypothetical protein [Agreia sp. VKM Ac-1783]|uniref:hypothetical protein n=1 Tax=Agreia sp. VKM Ac-1783 TaxID=1938889 RepID=UPI000A2AED8F|nr:hypothetical protein [Agreia sp. VKM Ac-1783]SMQ58288.1 hypothetical protein SAMN06295943_0146 [Agreia sp. VKM Ac-1783]